VCTASHYRLIKSGRLGVDLAAGLPHRDGGLAVLQELLRVTLMSITPDIIPSIGPMSPVFSASQSE